MQCLFVLARRYDMADRMSKASDQTATAPPTRPRVAALRPLFHRGSPRHGRGGGTAHEPLGGRDVLAVREVCPKQRSGRFSSGASTLGLENEPVHIGRIRGHADGHGSWGTGRSGSVGGGG